MVEKEFRRMSFGIRALAPSDDTGQKKVIQGYALEFNTLSDDLGGFRETLAPNCLANCDLSDVRCFINHDPNMILGRTGKNLDLTVDQKGLTYQCDLPDRGYADDLFSNISDGLITQCSFGFMLADNGDAWSEDGNGDYIRTITAISEIFDVSPVSVPAYRQTEVTAAQRSLDGFKKSQSEQIGEEKQKLELMKIRLKLEGLA
ncbi:MAG: HK97 family phage prohead protease [Sporolactobacillus sp.]